MIHLISSFEQCVSWCQLKVIACSIAGFQTKAAVHECLVAIVDRVLLMECTIGRAEVPITVEQEEACHMKWV